MKVDLRYIMTDVDRHGLRRIYVRRNGRKIRLRETPGTPEFMRAYNEAITPPMGPTLVVLGSEIQKDNAPNAKVPAYKPPVFVTIDATRAREIAKGLLDAQNPRIAVGRLRTPEGVKRAVELAELVGASTSTATA